MDDSRIVDLFWARDESAIDRTSEKYGPYCYSIAFNILNNSEDSDECVNDTYMSAWNSIPPKRPSVLRTFLGRIVRNLSIDLYRKKTAGKRSGSNADLILEELSECVSGKEDIDESVDAEEVTAAINDFLMNAKETDRKLFVLRYWYGSTVKSIAKKTGLTENNISVRLSRMRASLADLLWERGLIS